jgi:hemerythrin superfamily protein
MKTTREISHKSKKHPAGMIFKKGSTKRNDVYNDDIVTLILDDHKPLKALIKILKDSKASITTKSPAFEKFAPALLAHAKAEEQCLYVPMNEDRELRIEAQEGFTEHSIADELITEILTIGPDDQDMWVAKVKVLAELVDHHIEEEEGVVLKKVKKQFNAEERAQIGEVYASQMHAS